MSSQLLQTKLVKKNGKMVHISDVKKEIYEKFIDKLEEGHEISVMFDASPDNGTLAQLSKIHACIRELSIETGQSVEDLKLEIKKKVGLCFVKTVDNERFMFCKSLGDASKDELNLVIQQIIEMGDFVNLNLR
jgi:hypothetical protein